MIVLPQTWFAVVLFGKLWIVRLPLMVVEGPMVKLPPLVIVTPLPIVAPLTMIATVPVTLPVVPPPTKMQVCPLLTVRFPLKVPLYAPLQAVPEDGTDPV